MAMHKGRLTNGDATPLRNGTKVATAHKHIHIQTQDALRLTFREITMDWKLEGPSPASVPASAEMWPRPRVLSLM